MMMITVPLMYHGQGYLQAASLVEIYGFGDASSPCKIAAESFVSFSAMFGTNETWAGLKSSSEKT
jgi:hypothetical protein